MYLLLPPTTTPVCHGTGVEKHWPRLYALEIGLLSQQLRPIRLTLLADDIHARFNYIIDGLDNFIAIYYTALARSKHRHFLKESFYKA